MAKTINPPRFQNQMNMDKHGPEHIRPSAGTLGVLGLRRIDMAARPTTAYIMLGERCNSNCLFCTQRRDNPDNDRLSRVVWPEYPTESVVKALKERRDLFSRMCFQTLDYDGVVDDLVLLADMLRDIAPISVSMVPVSGRDMVKIREAGVEYLSIALDAANPDIFERVKGKGVGNRFTWEGHWNALKSSVKIFGNGNTHLIVGLGESDEDLIKTMIELRDIGVYTALFAFTPVNGGNPPDIRRYRAIQLSHALIYRHNFENFDFLNGKLSEINADETTLDRASRYAFLTSGCPGCNRPFYNERPGEKYPYNYPYPVDKRSAETGLEMVMNYVRSSQEKIQLSSHNIR